MTTTRPAILLRAAHKMPARAFVTVDGVNELTASGGTQIEGASTLIGAGVAPPNGYAASTHKNWHLYRREVSTGDRIAIVSSYSGTNRTWTTKSTFATASTSGKFYGVYKDDPNTWIQALNEALRQECFFLRYHEFTATDATKLRYDLSAAPITNTDLTRISQVVGLERHTDSEAAGAERWRPWADGRRVYDIEEDEATFTLDTMGFGLNTADEMRLVYTMPYTALTDDTTTSKVDIDWAAWATLLVMGRWLGDPNNNDDEWEVMRRKAQAECDMRGRLQLGRYRYKTVQRHSTPIGGVSVGGRRGR